MAVTFVGSYKIEQSGFAEMNPVTVDAAFAEDGDRADDDETGGNGGSNALEQLGRFCPLYKETGGSVIYDDFWGQPNPGNPAKPVGVLTGIHYDAATPAYFAVPTNGHRYAWAADLFDYFNVLSPQEGFCPNIDPLGTDPTLPAVANAQVARRQHRAHARRPAAAAGTALPVLRPGQAESRRARGNRGQPRLGQPEHRQRLRHGPGAVHE